MEIEVFENKKKLFYSAQCETVRSPTPRSVRQFWIFRHFNFPESDSAQYHTAFAKTNFSTKPF